MAGATRWDSVARIFSSETSLITVSWFRERWLNENDRSWGDEGSLRSLMEPNPSPAAADSNFLQRFVIGRGCVVVTPSGNIGVADEIDASSTLALGVGSCLMNESRDLLHML